MKTFRLWKDNRLDKEFNIERDELITKLKAWLEKKGIDYVHYYNSERLIRFFLTDKEEEGGMSSVFEESDFVAFYEDLDPIIRQFEQAA